MELPGGTLYRDNEEYEVAAFTATQIPNISGRRYPDQRPHETGAGGNVVPVETTERFPHGLGNLAHNARFPHSHSRYSSREREEKKNTHTDGSDPSAAHQPVDGESHLGHIWTGQNN